MAIWSRFSWGPSVKSCQINRLSLRLQFAGRQDLLWARSIGILTVTIIDWTSDGRNACCTTQAHQIKPQMPSYGTKGTESQENGCLVPKWMESVTALSESEKDQFFIQTWHMSQVTWWPTLSVKIMICFFVSVYMELYVTGIEAVSSVFTVFFQL